MNKIQKKTQRSEKLVGDAHFRDLVEMILPALNVSQIDRLWEALRLEVRRRYFNQGLGSALRAIDEAEAALRQGGSREKRLPLTKVREVIRSKMWERRKKDEETC